MASYGSKLTFDKTDLDHFPARVFSDFPRKIEFRVSRTKQKGDDLQVLKTRRMTFAGFPDFSLGQIIQTSQTPTRMIFPRPPNLPKPSKHVSTIGFYVFWAEGTIKCMRFFVPPG